MPTPERWRARQISPTSSKLVGEKTALVAVDVALITNAMRKITAAAKPSIAESFRSMTQRNEGSNCRGAACQTSRWAGVNECTRPSVLRNRQLANLVRAANGLGGHRDSSTGLLSYAGGSGVESTEARHGRMRSNDRARFRGFTGRPVLVVKTSSCAVHSFGMAADDPHFGLGREAVARRAAAAAAAEVCQELPVPAWHVTFCPRTRKVRGGR